MLWGLSSSDECCYPPQLRVTIGGSKHLDSFLLQETIIAPILLVVKCTLGRPKFSGISLPLFFVYNFIIQSQRDPIWAICKWFSVAARPLNTQNHHQWVGWAWGLVIV